MLKDWKYNKDSDCYLYGESDNGCGVYFDESTGGWIYNVIFLNNIQGPLDVVNSREKAMEEAIKLFDRLIVG